MEKLPRLPKDSVKEILSKAKALASKRGQKTLKKLELEIAEHMDREIERMMTLKAKNPIVRQEEIDWLQFQKEDMLVVLEKAELSLDSFRVIV